MAGMRHGFATLNSNNFVVYGQKHKVCRLHPKTDFENCFHLCFNVFVIFRSNAMVLMLSSHCLLLLPLFVGILSLVLVLLYAIFSVLCILDKILMRERES